MLRLRDLRKTRGQGAQRYSLEIPRLDLRAGQRLALVGPSGSGKSTVLDLLALILSPDAGGVMECELDGRVRDVAALWKQGRNDELAALRGRGIGYVLQTGGLLGYLDVAGNIGLSRALLGMPDDDTVRHLASHLEIADQLGKRPSALSVGQRQRVGIARALAHRPRLLLADEPTASLDPINAERVMQLLVEQARLHDLCLVVATHDQALAARAGLAPLPLALQRGVDGGVTATLAEAG
ncbi:ABC transporter ATP-binding protein [Pseudomonas tohonis]|uniref:ABC transporter ATP-binding protein n=1 Tax=Pseudomonas tohonis TaxID=2725477 RepID=A0A6J4E4Q0_9PSED|nr:ABC transporter ATP-binding protein [Pseudomonas tohonis]BCG24827.1 ABC transporter ATP-binding protein [Pseudomonas tohonis]GJN53934.1 ABC transporter ATP-binding protein [Pseudomonas tohonis]